MNIFKSLSGYYELTRCKLDHDMQPSEHNMLVLDRKPNGYNARTNGTTKNYKENFKLTNIEIHFQNDKILNIENKIYIVCEAL